MTLFVSEIQTKAPEKFQTRLQEMAYQALHALDIPFERVSTGKVVTMEDCALVNRKLHMNMVKTLGSSCVNY